MEYKGHVTCPRSRLVSGEDKIQPDPGSLAPLATLQPPAYTVFIVSSARRWVYKLVCPVYAYAQIQSHWSHCHLPAALWECSGVLSTQVGGHSCCQGAGVGPGRDALLDKAGGGCCRQRDQHVQDSVS